MIDQRYRCHARRAEELGTIILLGNAEEVQASKTLGGRRARSCGKGGALGAVVGIDNNVVAAAGTYTSDDILKRL